MLSDILETNTAANLHIYYDSFSAMFFSCCLLLRNRIMDTFRLSDYIILLLLETP